MPFNKLDHEILANNFQDVILQAGVQFDYRHARSVPLVLD